MRINENKNAVDNVWALINQANGTNLTAASGFSLGLPAVNTDPQPRDTMMTITANEGSGYQGSVKVYYNRRGMLDNVAIPQTTYNVTNEITTQELLAQFCAALKLVPTEVELAAPLTFRQTQVTLQPKGTTNLLYNAASVLSLVWPLPLLSELITVTLLNGFDKA